MLGEEQMIRNTKNMYNKDSGDGDASFVSTP